MKSQTSPQFAYLDASAIVKLVIPESETSALESRLAHLDGLLTSRLSVVEVTRAAGRAGNRKLIQRVEDVMSSFVVVEMSRTVAAAAGALPPAELKSLDAVHLATAASLDLGELGTVAFITYDHRLAAAAKKAGLTVSQPR